MLTKKAEILILIYKNNNKSISDVCRNTESMYYYVNKLTKFFEEIDLLKRKRVKNKIILSLTKKGKSIAEQLLKIQKLTTV
jgi:DNA-binding MarR family transcriptional regulator